MAGRGLTGRAALPHEGAMHGHELLATLQAQTAPAVAAVLRHAARHPIQDPARPELAELTEAGWRDAEAFGGRLTGYDRVRLFHSPIKRCRQTAEGIARGATRAGLAVEMAGERPELGVDYILDLAETGRLSVVHGEHFVRLWFGGEVPAQLIHGAPEIAARKLGYLSARLGEPVAEGRRLDLHVSHDWNVLVLRERLLGVRHEEAGWAHFLDGVTFTGEGAGLRAVYRDQVRVVAG